jgi:hypothetical protein
VSTTPSENDDLPTTRSKLEETLRQNESLEYSKGQLLDDLDESQGEVARLKAELSAANEHIVSSAGSSSSSASGIQPIVDSDLRKQLVDYKQRLGETENALRILFAPRELAESSTANPDAATTPSAAIEAEEASLQKRVAERKAAAVFTTLCKVMQGEYVAIGDWVGDEIHPVRQQPYTI